MVNHVFPWQQALFAQLQRERLPHAMLLSGPVGIGKWQFALALAHARLCQNKTLEGFACGSCSACLWVASHNHVDLHFVVSEVFADQCNLPFEGQERDGKKKSQEVSIDQARTLLDAIYVTPHTANGRVVLIAPADRAGVHAVSALLKVIEEPPPNTQFLLVTARPQAILATIVSRCMKLAMPVPDKEVAERWQDGSGLGQQVAAHPGIDFLALNAYRPLAMEQKLRDVPGYPDFVAACLATFSLGAQGGSSLKELLAAAEGLSKVQVVHTLELLQKWLFDIALWQGVGQMYYFTGAQQVIQRIAERGSAERTDRCLREVNALRKVAEHPLAPRLFIEHLLLLYSRLL